jgi:hypothetical protein
VPPKEEEKDSAKNATAVDSIVDLQNGTGQRINRGALEITGLATITA